MFQARIIELAEGVCHLRFAMILAHVAADRPDRSRQADSIQPVHLAGAQGVLSGRIGFFASCRGPI